MGQIWIDNIEVAGYAQVKLTPHAQQILGAFSIHRGDPGSKRLEQVLAKLAVVEFRGDLEMDGGLYYAVCSVELFSVVLATFLSGKFRSNDKPLVLKRLA